MMARPDVNSVVPARSSRTGSTANVNAGSFDQASAGPSRRTSSVMGPPPVPHNSSLPNSPRPPNAAMMEQSSSQGPIRHPRPLTAAELHLELEKEQESIVNRLTRELSALRAQTASVASTASSTSDLFTTNTSYPLPDYPHSANTGLGASIIPTSTRRHRSSSNLSARSARSARDTLQATSTSVSGVAAPRDADRDRSVQTSARQSLDIQRPESSRQNSYNLGPSASNSSNFNVAYRSPSNATSPYGPPPGFASYGRSSTSASHSRDASQQAVGLEGRSPSFSSASAAARYEEAAIQRQELEHVKQENEALKQRIRDLERQLAGTGAGAVTSTTANAT